jgi:hypothetical protein
VPARRRALSADLTTRYSGRWHEANTPYHGFQHVDIDDQESDQTRAFSKNSSSFTQTATGDLVVTWGFRPAHDYNSVIQLRNLGFFLVWFDGDRLTALQHFNRRGTVEETMFHRQIRNITITGVVDALSAPQINPFETDGEFRTRESIADELLALYDEQGR